jgi:hypothetical protein
MAFDTEPTHYVKTVLSDLQGTWENLRDAVVKAHPFLESDRLLFHIDEGMSWENVRNLANMRKVLLLVRNIAVQAKAPEEVLFWLKEVEAKLDKVLNTI